MTAIEYSSKLYSRYVNQKDMDSNPKIAILLALVNYLNSLNLFPHM